MPVFQKVKDFYREHKVVSVIVAALALALLFLLALAGTPANAEQFNIHSRVAAQESGFEIGTGYGCSTPAIVEAVMSEPSKEASHALFREFEAAGACVDFGRVIPVYAIATVKEVKHSWAETAVVWLFRVEYSDGTSDDFYWAMDKTTSEKVKEELGATGA